MLCWVGLQLCNRSARGRHALRVLSQRIGGGGGSGGAAAGRGAHAAGRDGGGSPVGGQSGAGGVGGARGFLATPWRRGGGTRHRGEPDATDSRLLGEL